MRRCGLQLRRTERYAAQWNDSKSATEAHRPLQPLRPQQQHSDLCCLMCTNVSSQLQIHWKTFRIHENIIQIFRLSLGHSKALFESLHRPPCLGLRGRNTNVHMHSFETAICTNMGIQRRQRRAVIAFDFSKDCALGQSTVLATMALRKLSRIHLSALELLDFNLTMSRILNFETLSSNRDSIDLQPRMISTTGSRSTKTWQPKEHGRILLERSRHHIEP